MVKSGKLKCGKCDESLLHLEEHSADTRLRHVFTFTVHLPWLPHVAAGVLFFLCPPKLLVSPSQPEQTLLWNGTVTVFWSELECFLFIYSTWPLCYLYLPDSGWGLCLCIDRKDVTALLINPNQLSPCPGQRGLLTILSISRLNFLIVEIIQISSFYISLFEIRSFQSVCFTQFF